mmetsp:Transcript_32125/g.50134  ORF Transcript_32125/g.50134 Transcript_32125/m.50134 type:complete len:397 (+) Transcript_32125:200-1390(+)
MSLVHGPCSRGIQGEAISLERGYAESVLDQLRKQRESNLDHEWMKVERKMNHKEAQAWAEELESLGCKYELHQDVLFVSLRGQSDGKNAVEEHLEQVFNVNSFHAYTRGNIHVQEAGMKSDIDVSVYRNEQTRRYTDEKSKKVPDIWVEVLHYTDSQDVARVKSKFDQGLMQKCENTIFVVVALPSLGQLKECGETVPWRANSSEFSQCEDVHQCFSSAREQAKAATPKQILVGFWNLDAPADRTFDRGGRWWVLTVDNYIELELDWKDAVPRKVRFYGIDLVYPDLKVDAQISSDDPDYGKATGTMEGNLTYSYSVGPHQAVVAIATGRQSVAAYRRFHQPSVSTSPAKSCPTPGGGSRRSPPQPAGSPAKRLRSTRSSASKHPTEFVYAGFCVS